jgi:hypothetical protein
MIFDASLSFIPIGSPLTIPTTTAATVASPNTIDLLGQGVGTAPANIIGTRTLFGADMGIGSDRPLLLVTVGTAFVTANSATLNVALQGAVDTASTYQPGTWNTYAETGAIAASNLTANAVIARFDIEAAFPPGTLPRYLRLYFTVASATAFSAGTISSALITMARDDYSEQYAAKNFTVA